jgi:hypothetical protein
MFKVSRKVQDLFNTPVPHELWHYTTVDGLRGIVSSGKVWATEARFTSDPTEYVFLRNAAIEFLKAEQQKQRLGSVGLDADALLELINIHYEKGVLSPGFADVFIASFSAAEDLKSQWIDYGMGYTGVSIAFDLQQARPPNELDSSVTLAPCVYKKDRQEELVREPVERFLEPVDALQDLNDRNSAIKRTWPIVESIWPNAGAGPFLPIPSSAQIHELLQKGAKDMSRELFVLASHFKNPKFEEEHEWRLVLPRSKKKNNPQLPIKYREDCWAGGRVQKPYIEWELKMPNTDHLPIVRVMTGPRCDAAEVKAILQTSGYAVPVCPSQVPVR